MTRFEYSGIDNTRLRIISCSANNSRMVWSKGLQQQQLTQLGFELGLGGIVHGW